MLKKYFSIVKLLWMDPKFFHFSRKIKSAKKTYLGYGRILSLAQSYYRMRKLIPGSVRVAEFGVGRGGSSMILAWLINSYGGNLTLFDVFGRIPSPTDMDGDIALQRFETILSQESKDYYGNLPDLLQVVQKDISQIISLNNVEFVVGKYEETLGDYIPDEPFHLVHIDCDWYESTATVLKFLEKHLDSISIIQIDDYLYWQGTQKAVSEATWLSGYPKRLVEGALVISIEKNNS